jgi:hypothetical protein
MTAPPFLKYMSGRHLKEPPGTLCQPSFESGGSFPETAFQNAVSPIVLKKRPIRAILRGKHTEKAGIS